MDTLNTGLIWVVDDNPIDSMITKKILIEKTFRDDQVRVFDDPARALLKLLSGDPIPDLIIMDINMPIYSAFDFIEEVVKVKPELDLNIWLTSALVSEEDKVEAEKYKEVIRVLNKPFVFDQFLSEVVESLRLVV